MRLIRAPMAPEMIDLSLRRKPHCLPQPLFDVDGICSRHGLELVHFANIHISAIVVVRHV
ncbi:hypothetical protein DYD83_09195 [Dickeya fangzhongdai]|uniref:Uncharacterized protein n=1 Tax=Dickeya fangzhongdai TaxID=1778540 RepID=A0A2K8QL38_9GAMM|nr:hypothetical protein CVE23_09150 [Dickeya fangzhongdai]AYH47787.1 hypothetical protein B6N31_08900 [Dickeya fangzhongdai]QOH47547.1 hypothetical protein DYD82_09195 [Dickeya fangzhongdai]QOH51853.1 hypothetical protein DYD83_09195 [Dickeya fangzhongdai]